MNKGDDPYEILGVPYGTEESQIKKAYFKLARQYHPDKQSTDEDKVKNGAIFARISDAYELLNDPVRRYDWKSANEGKLKNGVAQNTARPAARASPSAGPPHAGMQRSPPAYGANSMTRPSPDPTKRSRAPPTRPPNKGAPHTKRDQSLPRPQRSSWPEQRPMTPNPFEVLGIHWTADRVEVISAYRILAQKYHPSKQRNEESRLYAAKKMAEVSSAFEALKDPAKVKEWQVRCKGGPRPSGKASRRKPAARNSNGPLGGSMHGTSNAPLRPRYNEFRRTQSFSVRNDSGVPKLGLQPFNTTRKYKLGSTKDKKGDKAKDKEDQKKAKTKEKKEKKEAKEEKKNEKKPKKANSFLWKQEKKDFASDSSFGTAQSSENSLFGGQQMLIQT
eukprot:scaffold1170_cov122-Cylindrotheca_fusiformis.AAC.11